VSWNPLKALENIKVPAWLGPCASLLCLIHCFSLPILVIFIPTAHRFLGPKMAHDLHFIFWTISALVGYKVLDQVRAALWTRILFVSITVLAVAFLVIEQERMFHAFLLTMAVFQLGAVLVKHRNRQLHPPCCEHEHCEVKES
jgi:hypothetical protein